MSYTITWLNVLGLAAGILILAVGAFVLYARPRGTINRAFFGLALLDGVSSILFELWVMAEEPGVRMLFHATYYYSFIAFIAFLFVFGFLFPRPALGRRRWIIAGGVGLTVMSLVLLAFEPDLFWTIQATPEGLDFIDESLGTFFIGLFSAIIVGVLVKLAFEFRQAESRSHRRLTSLFIVAMGLGYAVPFIADLIEFGLQDPLMFLFTDALALSFIRFSELAGAVTLVAIIATVTRRWDRISLSNRKILLAGGAGFLVLSTTRLISANGAVVSQILALVAYPLILAYAIVTQEAFDINPQVRNAASVGAAGALFAAGFVIGEDFLQDVLAAGFLGEVASPVAVQAISAVLAAAINLPIFLGARRLAQRAFSGAVVDPKHLNNLATYRLVLEGALEDGILGARESKALETLRDELGIMRREHEEIAAQVHASFQDRHARADEPGSSGEVSEVA